MYGKYQVRGGVPGAVQTALLVCLCGASLAAASSEAKPFYEGYVYGCYTANLNHALTMLDFMDRQLLSAQGVAGAWGVIDDALAYAAQYHNPMNRNISFDHAIKQQLDGHSMQILVQLLNYRQLHRRRHPDAAVEQQITFLKHMLQER